MESIKYILLVLGVFLALFNDVLVKDKKDDQKGIFRFKKMTPAGKTILIIGFILSLIGILQTYNDELKSNREFKYKSAMDSLKYTNKIKSDSMHYSHIIQKLASAENRIESSTNDILKATTNESEKQVRSLEHTKFLIPNYFYVTFFAKIQLKKDELQQVKALIFQNYAERIEYINRTTNAIKEFITLDNPVKDKTDLSIYNQLHNIPEGIIFTKIAFLNKLGVYVFSLEDGERISLHNGRRQIIYNKNKSEVFSNYYYVYFDFKNDYVGIAGNKLELCSNRTNQISSLLEFANTKMQITIDIVTFDGITNLRTFTVDLLQLNLFTEDNLQIASIDFKKVDSNRFEKQLNNFPWK